MYRLVPIPEAKDFEQFFCFKVKLVEKDIPFYITKEQDLYTMYFPITSEVCTSHPIDEIMYNRIKLSWLTK